MNSPVVDIHCDLLSYLQSGINPDPLNADGIGCSFPSLKKGNVKLQVMAIYTSTQSGSTAKALAQGQIFKKLLSEYEDRLHLIKDVNNLNSVYTSSKLGIVAAIENASGFCEEDDSLEAGFRKLENLIAITERVLYVGLTHHGENRFGGGNTTATGLKSDGKALLDYLQGRKIAIDLSHASDALAHDILNHLSKFNLNIPVIASHSNFRKIFQHPRNLPDEIATEIYKRKGLVGINFLRAFLNNENPGAIYDHILYGINLGGSDSICFGADYFDTSNHPDQSRRPFFFKEQENSGCYPSILNGLKGDLSAEQMDRISNKNVLEFIERIWA
jgi:membrane dipeptidase